MSAASVISWMLACCPRPSAISRTAASIRACLVRAFRRSSRLAGTASFSDAALTVLPLWSRPASLLLLGALTVHRRAGDSLPDATPALAALGVSLAYLAAALTR